MPSNPYLIGIPMLYVGLIREKVTLYQDVGVSLFLWKYTNIIINNIDEKRKI